MEKQDKKSNFYADNRKAIKTFLVTLCFLGAFAWANLDLNIFSSGEVISSSLVNQNFQKLKSAFNSDLILKNTGAYTLVDPTGCKGGREAIKISASGVNAINYDTVTGAFSFPEGGLYEMIYNFKCDTCSKRNVYLCADVDVGTNNCLTESKVDSNNAVYIGEMNSSGSPSDRYLKVTANKVYRLVVFLCLDVVISNANDTEIYFRKVR